jgi:hypothetical protein
MKLMTKANKNAWLKALKSGDYPKGRYKLVNLRFDPPQYCCLGVAGRALLHKRDKTLDQMIDCRGGRDALLDNKSAAAIGITKDQQFWLAELNDKSDTWEPIIKYIEEHL